MHAAIELRSELVQRARTKLAALDCAHIDVRHGNCLEIDASSRREEWPDEASGSDEGEFFKL